MAIGKLKVLLIIESCNPEWASVPLVGYKFYEQISSFADVTLATHHRNESALRKIHGDRDIVYINPGRAEENYFKVIARLSQVRGRVIWPLRHLFQFPIYHFFDRAVQRMFGERVAQGEFDVVHAMTPMMPRYPYSLVRAARGDTPALIGPVNGGVPFPPAFKGVGLKEFSYLNFLRTIGGYAIPGYRQSYQSADLILAGSSYTKKWIEENLGVGKDKIKLFFENGVPAQSFNHPKAGNDSSPSSAAATLRLLFVGRLVPYKGCDMLLRSLAMVAKQGGDFTLTIVGDGGERENLQNLTAELGIKERVKFTGWVSQPETFSYYQQSDVFCFPSVREFGGAVVMEAMANSLPCIVVDNGGIGEYVSADNGFKIEPKGAEYVVEMLGQHVQTLIEDRALLARLAEAAYEQSLQFSWVQKGVELKEIYQSLLKSRKSAAALLEQAG